MEDEEEEEEEDFEFNIANIFAYRNYKNEIGATEVVWKNPFAPTTTTNTTTHTYNFDAVSFFFLFSLSFCLIQI